MWVFFFKELSIVLEENILLNKWMVIWLFKIFQIEIEVFQLLLMSMMIQSLAIY